MKKKAPKMNGLFKAAFIICLICVAAVIASAVLAYALKLETIGYAVSMVCAVMALVGVILASFSKPKKQRKPSNGAAESDGGNSHDSS